MFKGLSSYCCGGWFELVVDVDVYSVLKSFVFKFGGGYGYWFVFDLYFDSVSKGVSVFVVVSVLVLVMKVVYVSKVGFSEVLMLC